MDKVKILWISLNAPAVRSDRAGGNTFNYYFREFVNDGRFDVKVIAQRNNDFELQHCNEGDSFYLTRGGGLTSKLKRLSSIESKYNPWNRNANLISNQMENFVKKNIRSLKADGFYPDMVILEWTQCVVLARLVKKYYPDAFIVASEHDVTYIGYNRQIAFHKGISKAYWQFKYKWEKQIELNALRTCDLILPQNADYIKDLMDEGIENEKISVLVPYFNNMCNLKRASNGRDILFFGAMSRPENYLSAIWFIENVMPLLSQEDVRFVILGSSPPPELKKYESDRVHITGFVDSIEPYFQNAMCLVAPLVLGAGIKVKVLEAMSSGVPVITNTIGIEGISAEKNNAYIHCEEPSEYATAVRKAINGELECIGECGQRYVMNAYNLENSLFEYKEKMAEVRRRNK